MSNSTFYVNGINHGERQLSEEEARHCVQVLRHQSGDEITIFDGVGGVHRSVLTSVSKKVCKFEIIESQLTPRKPFRIHLAIAPTKNADRMEWLIEKLGELGVDELTLIKSTHSERKQLRLDRLEKKAISAMKQSGFPYKLIINELKPFSDFMKEDPSEAKFIAHVDSAHKHLAEKLNAGATTSILIGPEGDFSKEELELAKRNGYQPVSLGRNTLRTETAGLVACCMVNFVNRF